MHRVRLLAVVLIGYALFFIGRFKFPLEFLLFFIGLVIGYVFHILDRALQVIVMSEYGSLRGELKQFVQKGQFWKALTYLVNDVSSASATFWFVALYFPLAYYLISSSGSVIGIGLMLGLGLSMSAHFILGYKKVSQTRKQYFSLLKSSVSDETVKRLMSIFIVLFLLLSVFVVL